MGDALSDVSNQVQVQTSLSRPDYLLTQFRVIVTYLRLLVLPVNQNLDYDYPVYTTFLTPPVFLSFLLLAALFALAIYLFYATRRAAGPSSTINPQPSTGTASGAPTDPVLRLISFGILWFFLTLSVESSIIPIPDVIFEHRLYLPGFGAAASFAAAFCLAADRFFKNVGGTLLGLCAALLVLSLGVATFQRNQVWGDAIRLWQDAVAKSPGKARPYNNLGVALNRAGRSAEAIQVLSRAIAIDPMHPDAYNNLGRAYISTGQSSAALPVLRTAIRINAEFKGAYINLAAALNQVRQFRETVNLVEQNFDLLGDQVEAHYHLGVAYAFLGDRAAARRQLEIVSRYGAADLAADLMRLLR
jgi:tetratricopeptide (TPR) repeat protein